MTQIELIFQLPNTEENLVKRAEIISAYKEEYGIPANHGVNICDVIKWAETMDFNKNCDCEHINAEFDETDTDGFFLSYRVGDRVNTMSFPYDADIEEVGHNLYQFLAGCGFSENSINSIFVE